MLQFYILQVVGDTIGVDKSTVYRVVIDVAKALVAKQHCFIPWPTTNGELLWNKNIIYQCGGFPSVIGCVDGTHIRTQVPHYDENGYVNHKGFHSINMQGICNVEGKITAKAIHYVFQIWNLVSFVFCILG